MQIVNGYLKMDHCPHCSVPKPQIVFHTDIDSRDTDENAVYKSRIFKCSYCGNIIVAKTSANNLNTTIDYYPKGTFIDESIKGKAANFLKQATQTLHAPSGSIMLSASAVDDMLKQKGSTSGTLYERIEKAKDDSLITEEMETWAHEVRLDANDQRHADEEAPIPGFEDAKRVLNFALAFAEYLFVLPSKVQEGIANREDPGNE